MVDVQLELIKPLKARLHLFVKIPRTAHILPFIVL